MTDGQADVSRRGFLRAAAAGTATAGGAGAAATGTAAAAEDGGGGGGGGSAPKPDYGGWMNGVSNFSSLVDKRGQQEVTIKVGVEANNGFYGFGPPAVHVDPGTKVVWEWTGKGGSHNVVDNAGNFESKLTSQQGFTFSKTFDSDGMIKYFCQPHKGLGMKGVVVVGTDYPSVDTGGGGGPKQLPDSAKTLGIATSFVMLVTLGLAYFFLKYGGDYGEFE